MLSIMAPPPAPFVLEDRPLFRVVLPEDPCAVGGLASLLFVAEFDEYEVVVGAATLAELLV